MWTTAKFKDVNGIYVSQKAGKPKNSILRDGNLRRSTLKVGELCWTRLEWSENRNRQVCVVQNLNARHTCHIQDCPTVLKGTRRVLSCWALQRCPEDMARPKTHSITQLHNLIQFTYMYYMGMYSNVLKRLEASWNIITVRQQSWSRTTPDMRAIFPCQYPCPVHGLTRNKKHQTTWHSEPIWPKPRFTWLGHAVATLLVVVSEEPCGFWLWCCEFSRAEETHWLTRLAFGHLKALEHVGTALGQTELDIFQHVWTWAE